MNLQQQQQDPHTQELEEWQEDESGIEEKPINASYIMILVAAIGAVILTITFIAYRIAIELQDLPKIHIQPYQQALVQTIDRKATDKMHLSKSCPQFSTILRQVPIRDFSPSVFVQVERLNSAHRGYQYSIRKAQFQNAKISLQEFSFRQFSQNSRMTYSNYLEALRAFRINTFPIRDSSQELKELQRQSKQYFIQKYKLGRRLSQNTLCVAVELTKQGLQSGKYYYTFKSIFQQNYKNYKVIVINYPEMQSLQQVQNLLSNFQMKEKIVLLDRLQTSSKLQSSIYVYSSLKQYCTNSAMTIILKDTGELIGKEVFSIIDQTIHSHDPDLIITNYILESANPLRQKLTQTRYKVSLSSLYLSKPRQMPYKTKYLKVIKTQTLMTQEEKPFKNANGGWINGLFQANLQFSIIEYSCGNVVQLQQLLYKSSQKAEIENAVQILDARKQPQQTCRTMEKKIKEKEIVQKQQKKVNQTTLKQEKNTTTHELNKQNKNQLQMEENIPKIQNNMQKQFNTQTISNENAKQNFTENLKQQNTTKIAIIPEHIPLIIQKPSFELINQILQQNPNSLFTRSIETLSEQQIQDLEAKYKKQSISRSILYSTIDQKYREANDSNISNNSGISFKSLSRATNQLKMYSKSIIDSQNIPKTLNNPIQRIKPVQKHKRQQRKPFNNTFFNQTQFCLILTMQNNENDFSHLYSAQSIILQDYSYFRLFIIDNLSNDLTSKSMKYHLSKISQEFKNSIKLYKTKQKKSRSEILHNSIKQFCSPIEVVITLKSGQLLINKNVLLKLNEEYKEKKALSIYSNSISIINESVVIGPSIYPNYMIIQDKTLVKKELFAYSLLSYRASIFYNLKLNDFKDEKGKWITGGEDQILSFGIQQLSCNSIYYLNEILIFLPLTPESKILQTNISNYKCFQTIGNPPKNP